MAATNIPICAFTAVPYNLPLADGWDANSLVAVKLLTLVALRLTYHLSIVRVGLLPLLLYMQTWLVPWCCVTILG
jgi:hypothetical protein